MEDSSGEMGVSMTAAGTMEDSLVWVTTLTSKAKRKRAFGWKENAKSGSTTERTKTRIDESEKLLSAFLKLRETKEVFFFTTKNLLFLYL